MAIDYSKVDPILKEHPGITYKEFKKLCNIPISSWSFNNRRRILEGKSGYRNKTPFLASSVEDPQKTDPTTPVVTGKVTASELVELYAPNSRRKKEYRKIAQFIIDDPTTTYASLKKKGLIKFSDANFYGLRRVFLDGNSSPKRPAPKKPTVIAAPVKRRNGGMFLNIFEKHINGKSIHPETVELLGEFIDVLNKEKIGNFEMVEVISPQHVLEIRSFAKV